MNIKTFEEKKSFFGINGTGISSIVKKDITWTNKETGELVYKIPVGAHVHIWFGTNCPGSLFVQHENEVKHTRAITGHKKFTGINKPPTINTLSKWNYDGVAKSVTGKKVEPDGFGPDGSPSWEMVLVPMVLLRGN